MAVIHRKNRAGETQLPSSTRNSPKIKDGQGDGLMRNLAEKVIFALIISSVLYYLTPNVLNIGSVSSSESGASWKGNGHSVNIDFKKDREGKNTLGPHDVVVSTTKVCDVQPLRIRITGDTLLDVPLVEEEPTKWVGKFTIPIEGEFQVESHWRDCDANKDIKFSDFKATGQPNYTQIQTDEDLFVSGAWISGEKVKTTNGDTLNNASYIWADPYKLILGKELTPLDGPRKSIVLKESIATDDQGFYSFSDLGNYELVCWIGSKSAESIWEAFKTLRPQIFPHQRPFKFHYRKMSSFVTPDAAWGEDTRFRKCKHILISLDEPDEPLSQLEYTKQVNTFIKHLLNAFNEEHTFPALIWMFTVNESAIGTKNCHSAYLKKSTNHPCNDALNEIFLNNNFPERVRLLDNTDLSSPMRGTLTNEVFAAIALRIYVVVGKQVKVWRDAGISGGVNGVTTNGVTKPNFKLVRYDWSQKLEED